MGSVAGSGVGATGDGDRGCGHGRRGVHDSVRDAVTMLLDADPEEPDRDGLALIVKHCLRVRSWVDSIEACAAATTARLAREGRAEDAASLLSGGGRRGRRECEAVTVRGAVCEQMPQVADALANGDVTSGHVDAIANAARGLDDEKKEQLAGHASELVEAASSLSPEDFERSCRDLVRSLSDDDGVSRQESLRSQRRVSRWLDKQSGMHKTLLSLDPLADARVWAAVHAAIAAARAGNQDGDRRTWEQFQADVVVDLLTGSGDLSGRAGNVAEVSVLVDWQTLLHGPHQHGTCETSEGVRLPVDTVRRLGCDAELVAVLLGGGREPLVVGRSKRLATRAQRQALRAIYRSCAHPHCNVAFDACRIHHVTWWERGGATDLDNLVPLCEVHHHLVHEGGWILTLRPGHTAVWQRPDGTVWSAGDDDSTSSGTAPSAHDAGIDEQPLPVDIDQLIDDLQEALAEVTNRAPP